MKKLAILVLAILSFTAQAQQSNKPVPLPDYSPFRLDPFSFSFQVDPSYVIEGDVVAEVYDGNAKKIDSTLIEVTQIQNYVTVSFTQQQVQSLPLISQCYISWGVPRTRKVGAELKPSVGTSAVNPRKIDVGIVEVHIVGDTYNSMLAAQRAEDARDSTLVLSSAIEEYTDSSRIFSDSAYASRIVSNAKSIIATQQATIATSKADTTLILRNQALASANQTALDRIATGLDRDKAQADSVATAADRVVVVAARDQTVIAKDIAVAASTNASIDFKPLGTWNASTNTPTLTTNATAVTAGSGYEVSVAGTQSITGGSTIYAVNDKVISNGTSWFVRKQTDDSKQKIDALDARFVQVNLFNQALATDNFYVRGDNGAIISNTSYGYSDYIEVTPGATYTGSDSTTGMRYLAFYNSSKTFVSGGYSVETTTFTVPEDVEFVRVSYYKVRKAKFNFKLGSSPYINVPYTVKVASNVWINGTDLIQDGTHRLLTDAERVSWTAKLAPNDIVANVVPPSTNLFDRGAGTDNFYLIHNTGAPFADNSYGYSTLIKVTPGLPYTAWDGTHGARKTVHYDINQAVITTGNIGSTNEVVTFTVPANVEYVTLSYYKSGKSKFRFKQESSPSEYTPYDPGSSELISIKGATVGVTKTDLATKFDKSSIVTETIPASKNLFPSDSVVLPPSTLNNINTTTGAISTSTGFGRTKRIEVKPNTTYTISGLIDLTSRAVRFEDEFQGYISHLSLATNGVTFTTPLNTKYLLFTIIRNGQTANLTQIMLEEGAVATAYVSYKPVEKVIHTIDGAALDEGSKKVTLKNIERLNFFGDSYTDGLHSLIGKAWIANLSLFTDWNVENYAKSGDTYQDIHTRITTDAKQFHPIIGPKEYSGGGYGFLVSYQNDQANNIINTTDGLSVYLDNKGQVANDVKGLGYKPVIMTEHVNTTSKSAMLVPALSQLAEENGYDFVDVLSRSINYEGSRYNKFYYGTHPGVRTNVVFWWPVLKYVRTLPRPKTAIKIYRKRAGVSVSGINDLLFKDRLERNVKMKEILVSQSAINAGQEKYYDDLNTLSGIGISVQKVYEYLKLINKESVAFTEGYGLVECVVNATAGNVKTFGLSISDTTVAVYVKDWNANAWVQLQKVTNNGETIYGLSNLKNQIQYDKVQLLLYKSGGFSLTDIYYRWSGTEGKDQSQRKPVVELTTTELLSNTKVDVLTGWTVTGSLTPFTPTDNSFPTGLTKAVTLTTSNYLTQAVTFSTDVTRSRKVQVKLVSRTNPVIYSSAGTYPTGAAITDDTYDVGQIVLEVKLNTDNVIKFKDIVGTHWTDNVFEFNLPPDVTTVSFIVKGFDKDIEFVSASVKIEQ